MPDTITGSNLYGIKFLAHDMGCGGTRLDSDALCGLLVGYITHPNVAGATVLSLGCQPTGNPIAPVIKLSTNTQLFNMMPDIIDIDSKRNN